MSTRPERTCGHRETIGFQEYRCGLSGASIEAACPALDDLCIPMQALEYAAGRFKISRLSANHRDAIRSIVRRLGPERLENLIMAQQTTEQPAAPSVATLASLSEEQLRTLRAEAMRELRDRKKLAQSKPKLLARFRANEAVLMKRSNQLQEQLAAVRQALDDLEAGRMPDAKLRQRTGRVGHPMSPETRRKIGVARRAAAKGKR